ncbi:MAG: Panacea domain-containing protein [Betaproteobacteria bacterium]
MFNERKVAQMAAFFLHQAGGILPVLSLTKLLYLAEREAINRFDEPMAGDRMVSMPHGPVLSQTLGLTNGEAESDGAWASLVAGRAGYEVELAKGASANPESLGALSDADIQVLSDVWKEFGHLDRFALRDRTHDICKEWKDPNGSSKPIRYQTVFLALGRDQSTAVEASKEIERGRFVSAALARL